LIVLENEEVCRQAVDYARELAGRMGAEVTLLMLVEMALLDRGALGRKRSALNELDERAGRLLAEIGAEFLREGIATSAALRVGDPAQELVKFLAERPPFQVAIWGSGQELPAPARRHWLAKAAGALECSLLAVQARQRPQASAPAAEAAGEQPTVSNTGRSKPAGDRKRQ